MPRSMRGVHASKYSIVELTPDDAYDLRSEERAILKPRET